MPRRRIAALVIAALGVLGGVLLVGYLPSRVDGGVEPIVRRMLALAQALGAPEWVNYEFAGFLANIGFFVPVGLVAALLLPWRFWWLAVPVGAALSAALEVGQALFLPDRVASASDVLANTLGAVLGALIGAAIRSVSRRGRGVSSPRAGTRRPAPPAAPR